MKISTWIILFLAAFSTQAISQNFSGKIVYQNSFTDLKQNDITEKMSGYFGKVNNYFINNSNYKAYNEDNRLLYLYNSSTNTYYSFDPGSNTVQKINAETVTEKKITSKILPGKETICGFECSSVEIQTESGTTIYYFSPLIKVDTKAFLKHNYGEWNYYLGVSGGALPLKIFYTSKKMGFAWTALAIEVKKIDLIQNDFAFPPGIDLKN